MADVFTPDKRRQVMSKIRGKDTWIERTVRKELWDRDFQYWKHVESLPGKPDALLRSYPVAVFTHSCFFHGHQFGGQQCHLFKWPSSPKWQDKILKNRERDERQVSDLTAMGYRVLVVWECALKGKTRRNREEVVNDMIHFIHSDNKFYEITGAPSSE